MLTFSNPNDPGNIEITKKLKEWVRLKFKLHDGIDIIVNEIHCAEPNCPDMETQIIILTAPEIFLRIRKPLTYIRKWDVELLMA